MADTPVLAGLGDRHYGYIEIPLEKLALGTNAPAAGNVDLFQFYSFTLVAPHTDDGNFTFRIPQDWFIGTDMDMQMYWGCNEGYAANNGEVRWAITHEPIAVGEVIGTGVATTVNGADTDLPAVARTEVLQTFTIANALIVRADLIRVTLNRIVLTGGNNPAAGIPEVYSILIRYARRFPQPSAV